MTKGSIPKNGAALKNGAVPVGPTPAAAVPVDAPLAMASASKTKGDDVAGAVRLSVVPAAAAAVPAAAAADEEQEEEEEEATVAVLPTAPPKREKAEVSNAAVYALIGSDCLVESVLSEMANREEAAK